MRKAIIDKRDCILQIEATFCLDTNFAAGGGSSTADPSAYCQTPDGIALYF